MSSYAVGYIDNAYAYLHVGYQVSMCAFNIDTLIPWWFEAKVNPPLTLFGSLEGRP